MADQTAVGGATPLAGIRVLDLTTAVAGPFGTLVLADLGCQVVKIEGPNGGDSSRRMAPVRGDGSAYFYAVNRNKSSVTVDIDTPDGLAAIEGLLSESDVFVTNLRERTTRAWRLDADSVLSRHPRIVYGDLSGYGIDGHEASRAGYDSILQARSGLTSINGSPGGPRARVGVSLLDMGAGLWLATGIVAALRHRDISGRGCRVSTSLLEVGASLLSYHIAAWQLNGQTPAPLGSEHPSFAPYGIFRTADGEIAVGVATDEQFGRLATALAAPWLTDDPRFATNVARVANRGELRADLERLLSSCPTVEWESIITSHDVAADTVATVPEALDDPQLAANDMWLEVPFSDEAEAGLRLPGIPLRFDRVRPPLRSPPPRYSEPTTPATADER